MDNDQTFIEQPKPGSGKNLRSELESLPPMPPAPEPPGKGGGRRWLLRELIIGLVVILVCLGGGFALWQSARSGLLPMSIVPTITPNAEKLGLTAEALAAEQALLPTGTATPEPTLEPTATLPAPTDTAEPTQPPTDTPVPTLAAPVFTTAQALFCRQGPSATYDIGRALNEGQSFPIVGRSVSPVDGTSVWWQIDLGDRLCFVSEALGSASGDVDGLEVIPAPPTVTPTPTSTPTQTPTPTGSAP